MSGLIIHSHLQLSLFSNKSLNNLLIVQKLSMVKDLETSVFFEVPRWKESEVQHNLDPSRVRVQNIVRATEGVKSATTNYMASANWEPLLINFLYQA